MRHLARVLVFCVVLVSGGAASGAWPQATTDPQYPQQRRDPNDPMVKMEKEQQKRINKERQEALKKDTDRLLELATELKMYVDKSNEHTLSMDVIKKAEQIEKLARSVREKMKGN